MAANDSGWWLPHPVETPRPVESRRSAARISKVGRTLAASLTFAAIGAAGCGSSKNETTSSRAAASVLGTPVPSTYRAGQLSTTKTAAVYTAQGLKCVRVKGVYRLRKS